jgi:hypothetical protein
MSRRVVNALVGGVALTILSQWPAGQAVVRLVLVGGLRRKPRGGR